MGDFFHFRHFKLHQRGAAAKVGTDAMLLGAWVNPGDAENILDIGTGTGVLALMLAQKSAAMIDAVELDETSAQLAKENFDNSPWSFRLQVYQDDFVRYAENCTLHYNLIISNPPFFNHGFDAGYGSERRRKARSQSSLSFSALLTGVKKLLTEDGRFALIIPAGQEAAFMNEAEKFGLYPVKICLVKSFEKEEPKRLLLEMTNVQGPCRQANFVIYQSPRQYSVDYIKLTAEFHAEGKLGLI